MFDIPIKTEKEILIMREGGHILAHILQLLKMELRIGLDVFELEEQFIGLCKKYKVGPACKNYTPSGFPPFPTGLCISVNDQSVHCFPVRGNLLKDGDLITIDTVIEHKGYFVDSAITEGVGNLNKRDIKLLNTTKKALAKTIQKIKPGIRTGVLSHTIQKIVEKEGYSVLTEYAGHGIGKSMHEPPEIPCFGFKHEGPRLKAGMTLAIEPLVCENNNRIKHKNHWVTKTADGGNFVQFEHTVLVTNSSYEILTTEK